MNNSIWVETTELPKFETLQDNIKTDVLIIGGGMCGILCAYLLHQAGISYVLAEATTIAHGVTQNTTAKVTSQHALIYQKIVSQYGSEYAKLYLDSNETAISEYRKLSQKISCDFEDKDSYVYLTTATDRLIKEVHILESLNFPATYIEEAGIPVKNMGAVKFPRQAQFHPLKFISGIAKGLNIYEHTFIKNIKNHTAFAEYGSISATQIIVTTHFPFLNKHGLYFTKLYQERSYVIALEHATDINGMYIDETTGGLSFRNYNNLLLLGGGSHRTGQQGGTWQELRNFAHEHYPKAIEKYAWATQDCMSLDNIPYIGRYSAGTKGLYVATGFNKWGMTSSMVAAMILKDMITGKDNEWFKVFSPQRSMLKKQLFINLGEATKNLLTISKKRCPHMGCSLKWNQAEHTWDCPCHGSRFEENGNLIDNPAKKDAFL